MNFHIDWNLCALFVGSVNGVGIASLVMWTFLYRLTRAYQQRKLGKLRERFGKFWAAFVDCDDASIPGDNFTVKDLVLLLPDCVSLKDHDKSDMLFNFLSEAGVADYLQDRLKNANHKKRLIILELLSHFVSFHSISATLLAKQKSQAANVIVSKCWQDKIDKFGTEIANKPTKFVIKTSGPSNCIEHTMKPCMSGRKITGHSYHIRYNFQASSVEGQRIIRKHHRAKVETIGKKRRIVTCSPNFTLSVHTIRQKLGNDHG